MKRFFYFLIVLVLVSVSVLIVIFSKEKEIKEGEIKVPSFVTAVVVDSAGEKPVFTNSVFLKRIGKNYFFAVPEVLVLVKKIKEREGFDIFIVVKGVKFPVEDMVRGDKIAVVKIVTRQNLDLDLPKMPKFVPYKGRYISSSGFEVKVDNKGVVSTKRFLIENHLYITLPVSGRIGYYVPEDGNSSDPSYFLGAPVFNRKGEMIGINVDFGENGTGEVVMIAESIFSVKQLLGQYFVYVDLYH